MSGIEAQMKDAERADYCVGYLSLRGWQHIGPMIDHWPGGERGQLRLLVGMGVNEPREARQAYGIEGKGFRPNDRKTARKLRDMEMKAFRDQLDLEMPTEQAEQALRALALQIRQEKVKIKVYMQRLHAKLYVHYRRDNVAAKVALLGSSNLSLGGLQRQGELNTDVVDQDAAKKLSDWFQDRWEDEYALDVSEDLAKLIEESWAREDPLPPYHAYLKIAKHLAAEALEGEALYTLPKDLEVTLFDYQKAAARLATRIAVKRGGVLIGDVVGLGKTLIAIAIARLLEEDGHETLILCPKNLQQMWEGYVYEYGLRAARVVKLSEVIGKLGEERRYRTVIVDESHRIRNRETKTHQEISRYIERNGSTVILLTGTPYNKAFNDLSGQLRLFVKEDERLDARPERLLRQGESGESSGDTLRAFEASPYSEDWRRLLSLYMVRRTRSYIMGQYAHEDETGRKYLVTREGERNYFPKRVTANLEFEENAQYQRLVSAKVINTIGGLRLPRYALGRALDPTFELNPEQQKVKDNLTRAGNKLIGFCRSGLLKRLESSGYSFLRSVKAHVRRNEVLLYALQQEKPIPIGPQHLDQLECQWETDVEDGDEAWWESGPTEESDATVASIYEEYSVRMRNKFQWMPPEAFLPSLKEGLEADVQALRSVLTMCYPWNQKEDTKLLSLKNLIDVRHAEEKVLVFTQFRHTAEYVIDGLRKLRATEDTVADDIEIATGATGHPEAIARQFSPRSQRSEKPVSDEKRVLVCTDVLSEGHNLQDCHIVVAYDLPWTVIRLVQRVGRVDRIGQASAEVKLYTFTPSSGIEELLNLKSRVKRRLEENAETVGSDELFFEEDREENQKLIELYHENSNRLNEEDEGEVDLVSEAYKVWETAKRDTPEIAESVEKLGGGVHATRHHKSTTNDPAGTLVYVRTRDGVHLLRRLTEDGVTWSESARDIFEAARCAPGTLGRPRAQAHHEQVEHAARTMAKDAQRRKHGLGKPTSTLRKLYDAMKIALGQCGEDERVAIERLLGEAAYSTLTGRAEQQLRVKMRDSSDDLEISRHALKIHAAGDLWSSRWSRRSRLGHEFGEIVCSIGLKDAERGTEK